MNTHLLENSPLGRLEPIGNGFFGYVPSALPHQVGLNPRLVRLLDDATRAVGTLQGVGETLPSPDLLVQPFVRREAVLSSMIEGTQTLLSDLLLYEATSSRQDLKGDAGEVLNYIRAMRRGIELLQDFPISARVINAMHAELMDGIESEDRQPGAFRNVQVIIAGGSRRVQDARYIPPPPHMVPGLIAEWERFVNEPLEMPPLIQCALMHYQFEAIHPYQDGNGRLGRLLIGLLLHATNVLTTPLLYVSGYFERYRTQYLDHLLQVSVTGDWQPWLAFFLEGVADQANDALQRSRQLRRVYDDFRQRLIENGSSSNTLRLLDMLFETPYVTPMGAAVRLGISRPGAQKLLDRVAGLGILTILPKQRPQLYVSPEILDAIQS